MLVLGIIDVLLEHFLDVCLTIEGFLLLRCFLAGRLAQISLLEEVQVFSLGLIWCKEFASLFQYACRLGALIQ